MKYAQTGIRGYVPPGGACTGHRYEDRPDRDDEHMSVECPRCEPHLAGDPLWAGAPDEVPLTALEEKAAEAAKAASEAIAAGAVTNLVTLLGAAAANPEALAALSLGKAPAAEKAAPKRARKPAAASS